MSDLPVVPIETITIEHPDDPGGKMIINKSDFDPAIHRPFEPAASGESEIPQLPASGSKKVTKVRSDGP